MDNGGRNTRDIGKKLKTARQDEKAALLLEYMIETKGGRTDKQVMIINNALEEMWGTYQRDQKQKKEIIKKLDNILDEYYKNIKGKKSFKDDILGAIIRDDIPILKKILNEPILKLLEYIENILLKDIQDSPLQKKEGIPAYYLFSVDKLIQTKLRPYPEEKYKGIKKLMWRLTYSVIVSENLSYAGKKSSLETIINSEMPHNNVNEATNFLEMWIPVIEGAVGAETYVPVDDLIRHVFDGIKMIANEEDKTKLKCYSEEDEYRNYRQLLQQLGIFIVGAKELTFSSKKSSLETIINSEMPHNNVNEATNFLEMWIPVIEGAVGAETYVPVDDLIRHVFDGIKMIANGKKINKLFTIKPEQISVEDAYRKLKKVVHPSWIERILEKISQAFQHRLPLFKENKRLPNNNFLKKIKKLK